MPVREIIENGYDPTGRNSNGKGEISYRSPSEILASLREKEENINKILEDRREVLE